LEGRREDDVPSVSKVAAGRRRVHITGVEPRAMEICVMNTITGEKRVPMNIPSILPGRKNGGYPLNITKKWSHHLRRNPRTSLIIFLDHPSSAIISPFVNVLKLGRLLICTAI
jgi:hypothetical protein